MTATKADPLSEVKAWLLAKKPEAGDLDLDLDLIENRILDSLGFLEFLYFLEEVTGRELQVQAGTVNSFRTLRAIRDNIIDT